jgi:hypothetical protein
MAGAFDRDYDIKTGATPTGPTTPVYKDPIQVKTELGATQKEYIDTRSQTRVELDGIVKTLGQIKSEIDKDPASKKYNLNGVVVTRKELLAYYNSASASTAEALKLQAIIDANDNANAGASDEAKKLLKSDAIFVAQGGSGISNTGKYYLNCTEVSKEQYGNGPTGINRGGGSGEDTGSGSSGGSGATNSSNTGAVDKTTSDAFSVLSSLLEQYNLSSLSDSITRMMKSGLSAQEATVKLKYDTSIDTVTGKAWNAPYTLRFAGNEKRKAAGLNAVSEAEYLGLEDTYAETLKAYGLSNMLSTSRIVNEAKFAQYIGNDMSGPEFKDRISTVSDRVINADPTIKAAFKQYYPNLTDQDLVEYFLSPKDTLPKLKQKATAAEIGGAFVGQGLSMNLASAEGYAAYGIDRAGALEGASNIAGVLPETTKLGNVYGETGIQYTQQTGEEEFLKSSDAAKRKRNILMSKERASFDGSSGTSLGAGALSTQYLRKNSSAGQF